MASYKNSLICFCVAVLQCLHTCNSSSDVVDLKGEAGFRSIDLEWKARTVSTPPSGFLIKYCEDQAWGKHRCKEKKIDKTNSKVRQVNPVDSYILYEASIDGLRLATNYTVEVNPTLSGDSIPPSQRARALGGNLFIQTKGFYARAINCLSNSSLVEIETGPYFGGKISVEGTTIDDCSVQGHQTDPKSSYLLSINHSVCGSVMQNSSVKTFIIVQENLPILTHSTRRFMVVCKYVPGTFTVRAGVNLPDYGDYPDEENSLVPIGNDVSEVDPSELFDSTNSLFNSRVAKQVGRALRFSSEEVQQDTQKWAHLVLMVGLIISTVVGVTCASIYFVRKSKARRNGSGLISSQADSEVTEDGGISGQEAALDNDSEDGVSSHYSLTSPYPASLISTYEKSDSLSTSTIPCDGIDPDRDLLTSRFLSDIEDDMINIEGGVLSGSTATDGLPYTNFVSPVPVHMSTQNEISTTLSDEGSAGGSTTDTFKSCDFSNPALSSTLENAIPAIPGSGATAINVPSPSNSNNLSKTTNKESANLPPVSEVDSGEKDIKRHIPINEFDHKGASNSVDIDNPVELSKDELEEIII